MTEPNALEELKEYILQRLPEVLERDPRFVIFIEGIVADKFPRRDEFARLLEEVQQHRLETRQQFERVDQHLERVDQHLEQVDQHLEQVDQHLEQVDQHLEQVDQHLERIDRRFEQVDQRFEQIDQRFEQIDQRFEQVDQRFEQIDQRFEQVDQRFNTLEQRVEEGFREVQVSIDRLGARWGIRNEKIFRQTMRELLEESFGVTVEERHIRGEQFDCVIYDGQHVLIEITASVGPNILERLQRKRQLYIDEIGIVPARFLLVVGSIVSRRIKALQAAGFEVIEPEDEEE